MDLEKDSQKYGPTEETPSDYGIGEGLGPNAQTFKVGR